MKLAALILALSLPALAGDASTDKQSPVASVMSKIRCIDGPHAGCMTCVHPLTEQFQIVCGLPAKPAEPKKGAKK